MWDSSSRPSYARAATTPRVAPPDHRPWPQVQSLASSAEWLLPAATDLGRGVAHPSHCPDLGRGISPLGHA